MRVLFSFVGGYGHFEPLLPVARATAERGHSVAFTAKPAMLSVIEASGFDASSTGDDVGSPMTERLPLRRFDPVREEHALTRGFSDLLARNRASGVRTACLATRPDLIVCDEIDFGAMVAAESLGIPHAGVLVIASGGFIRPDLVAQWLDPLRIEYGLEADPNLAMLSRSLVIAPFPPSFRDPAFPLPTTAHSIRPTALTVGATEPAPSWPAARRDKPRLYFTLGTEFNREAGDLFGRVIAGAAALPVEVVVTVGHGLDPDEIGPVPPNVRVERHVPQSVLLPHCDLVISHGGSGTVAGALAHGLPQIVLPMGADQGLNGDRCAQLHLGRVLDAVDATPEVIRAAAAELLTDPLVRHAVDRVRAECLALPDATSVIPLLEQLDTRPS